MKAILRVFPFVLFLCCLLASCDDGNVEETYRLTREGKVASLKMNNVTGAENWADGYTLAFAAFSENSDYAIMLKYIRTVRNGKLDMVLSNIPDSVTSVELCVVNRLRQRVVTFASVEGSEVTAASENDTIYLRQDNLSLSMFAALQENVFNTTCINCHGGSNFVAANLNLTEGKSHAALVGQPSSKVASHRQCPEKSRGESG